MLLHLVAIAILVNAPLRPPLTPTDDNVITMRLLPAIEQPPPAIEETPPDESTETERDAERLTPPIADQSVSAIDEESPPADAAPIGSSDQTPDRARTENLRARLLDQVGALTAEPDVRTDPGLPWTASGESIPGVPGFRGWISAYVGTVRPSAQTWKDNDGTSRGRYVLANGTVVCTRRRAPTIDELMNPWKSVAVTMGSICGRERPEGPDLSNPRVQPAPSAAETRSDTGK